MKVYGDIERVNLSTGERFQRVTGDGESRLVRVGAGDDSLEERVSRLERQDINNITLGPRQKSYEEQIERANQLAELLVTAVRKFTKENETMRCKVHCSMKQPYGDGFYLNFCPVYTGSEENKEFFKYTPGGTVIFNVVNKAAADRFEVGKEYYLDFTPAG